MREGGAEALGRVTGAGAPPRSMPRLTSESSLEVLTCRAAPTDPTQAPAASLGARTESYRQGPSQATAEHCTAPGDGSQSRG